MNSTLFPTYDGANNNTVEGLPMSSKLTIGVLTGVAVFGVVIIIIVVVCLLVQSKKKRIIKKSVLQNPSSRISPITSSNSQFRSSSDIPPVRIDSSNGQYKEYDNWAYTPASDELDYPDVVSNLNQKNTAGNRNIRWTTTSLRAHDNYDYERYSRIPRAKLYSRKEELTS